jgi:hypothetical protein
LNPQQTSDHAIAPVTGTILLTGITIIAVILALILCLGFQMPTGDPSVPAIFVINQIRHVNSQGILDYDSYMVVQNSGKIAYDNRKLYARTYRNGVHLPCDIPTMNGHDFLPTAHYGIQTLGGFGSHDFLWYPDATIAINYAKGTFHPGDTVQFDVYDRTTNTLISRDTFPEQKKYDTRWFYNNFLNHQAA